MAIVAHIEVDGLREMQAALKKAQGKLPAGIGEAHKNVGRFIIGKLEPGDPHAVGAGAGSEPRASATKRDVLIRVGGSGRVDRLDQWGKEPVQPFRSGRPYIVGPIEENVQEITDLFLDEVIKVVGPAFFSVE